MPNCVMFFVVLQCATSILVTLLVNSGYKFGPHDLMTTPASTYHSISIIMRRSDVHLCTDSLAPRLRAVKNVGTLQSG